MSRPYICFGTTVIVSMLVFCKLEFISVVAITVAALVCCVPFFFLRNKNDILNSIFVCLLSLVVASSVFITKTVTDYEPAVILASEEKRIISGTLYEYEIIDFEKAEYKAIITVEFYKDPLQTQVDYTVKYTLKKV